MWFVFHKKKSAGADFSLPILSLFFRFFNDKTVDFLFFCILPDLLFVLSTKHYPQAKFTADQHPQYIYSPRELSRWVRAMYEAMNPLDAMTLEELVRLWANEALRLFHDRLVTQEEQDWCQEKVIRNFASRYLLS